MTYAIIGSGAIGTALAAQFARNDIDVLGRQQPRASSLADLVGRLGKNIKAASVQEAVKADTVILAVPFGSVPETVRDAAAWTGASSSMRPMRLIFPPLRRKISADGCRLVSYPILFPGLASSRHSTLCRPLCWPAILRRTADIALCFFQATMPRPKPMSRH